MAIGDKFLSLVVCHRTGSQAAQNLVGHFWAKINLGAQSRPMSIRGCHFGYDVGPQNLKPVPKTSNR
ncbi:unnamed protein product [Dovyalis caffra]|uniref:Uncharacterized protein n=1 Tax=Dovyalis caffra TaxID=77055 RepID=A0AAV1RHV6_9ROSI|nr:unnamed protein product [Dovyalis caffra]